MLLKMKTPFKILVKFPSRERPEKFILALKKCIDYSLDPSNISYLITLDQNDPRLISYKAFLTNLCNSSVKYIVGNSTSKIHAINRDLQQTEPWDIIVLMSDDMICQKQGWDTILRDTAQKTGLDQVFYFWDGDLRTKRHNNGKGLNTMIVCGHKYFNRFNYLYHSEYSSLWCDNEWSDVSQLLKKEYRSDIVLFRHVHFSNTPGLIPDALMRKTQAFYTRDQLTYNRRKASNFGLK
jgi:hypothetical protein